MSDRPFSSRFCLSLLLTTWFSLALGMIGCGGGGGGGGMPIPGPPVANGLSGTVSIPASLSAILPGVLRALATPTTTEVPTRLPVPGATVWIEGLPALGTVMTDASGAFSFADLPAGEHRVVARFVDTAGKTFKTRSPVITLTGAGATALAGDQLLGPATKCVRGVLRDATGAPLPNGTIFQLRAWGESIFSNPDGSFVSPLFPDDETEISLGVERESFSLPILEQTLAPWVELPIGAGSTISGTGISARLLLTRGGKATDRAELGETLEAQVLLSGLPPGTTGVIPDWSVSSGTLSVDPVNPASARWRVQDVPGMASIAIRLASAGHYRIELPVMIGLSAPVWADPTTPEVVSYSPEAQEEGLNAASAISIVFSKPLSPATVNATTLQIKNAAGALSSGTSTVSRDGRTVTHFLKFPRARRDTVFVLVTRNLRDLSGNSPSKPVFWSFGIEDSAVDAGPVAVLSNLPEASTTSRIASITVGGEGVVSYKYALDAASWSDITGTDTPIIFADLEAGPHALAVLGCNATGTWQANPTWATWSINLPIPIAILNGLPSSPTASTTVAIGISGIGVTGYRYSLDDGVWSLENPVTATLSLDHLASGKHTIRVLGRDADGLWQPSRIASSFTWTIDTTPPTARIADVTPNPRNTAVSELKVLFSEPVRNVAASDFLLSRSGTAVSLDGAILTRARETEYHLEIASGSGSPGSYTFSLLPGGITDEAGNPLSRGATTTWLLDPGISPAPTNVTLLPVGGTIVADTLNSTNTNLTAQASIMVGGSAGGSAELLINGLPFPKPVTDTSISPTDTRVTFDLGATGSSALQQLVPTGGAISVRLLDKAGNAVVSAENNPTLRVSYAPLTASFGIIPERISGWPASAGLTLTFSSAVASTGIPLLAEHAEIKSLTGSSTTFSFAVHPTGRGTPRLLIATGSVQDRFGNPNPRAIVLTIALPGSDGSDVVFPENGQNSVYILVPRVVLTDGSIQPPFYLGKFPATAGGTSSSGPLWMRDATFQPDGDDARHAAATLASGKPWVSISWKEAKAACTLAGASLVSERQWLAVASDALAIGANWRGSVMYRGLSASTVARGQASSESQPAATSLEYRKKVLSNGAVIWDLGGNVWQWVDGTQPSGSWYTGDTTTGWIEATSPAITNPLLKLSLGSSPGAAYGIGRVFNFSADSTRVMLRGGRWDESDNGGLFALRLNRTESDKGVGYGFREARSVASFTSLQP